MIVVLDDYKKFIGCWALYLKGLETKTVESAVSGSN